MGLAEGKGWLRFHFPAELCGFLPGEHSPGRVLLHGVGVGWVQHGWGCPGDPAPFTFPAALCSPSGEVSVTQPGSGGRKSAAAKERKPLGFPSASARAAGAGWGWEGKAAAPSFHVLWAREACPGHCLLQPRLPGALPAPSRPCSAGQQPPWGASIPQDGRARPGQECPLPAGTQPGAVPCPRGHSREISPAPGDRHSQECPLPAGTQPGAVPCPRGHSQECPLPLGTDTARSVPCPWGQTQPGAVPCPRGQTQPGAVPCPRGQTQPGVSPAPGDRHSQECPLPVGTQPGVSPAPGDRHSQELSPAHGDTARRCPLPAGDVPWLLGVDRGQLEPRDRAGGSRAGGQGGSEQGGRGQGGSEQGGSRAGGSRAGGQWAGGQWAGGQ
ncbi:basic proline-rich protein-like [Poecile atricapillus]|uniref:basic proline-rich protein-like n=1 Tax=Poecile atricapillus TaxID=48891 RepID=UPI002739C995|nr:basic proline-rich protein-like [Poecile atricapillus]